MLAKYIVALFLLIGCVNAFRGGHRIPRLQSRLSMIKITEGVEFDTIAREWRLKWSPDNDKMSLQTAQQTLTVFLPALKKLPGVKIQRIVCGGCLDYKVIVALPADKFKDWEANNFAPESDFINALKTVPGVSQMETQTYTIMPVL